MATTIEFNGSAFPSLILRDDLTQTWNNIGLDSLPSAESEPLLKFLELIEYEKLENFNPDSVLLVKANGGVMQAVYAAAIFRDGESIVLKLGDNQFPITQKGDLLHCGKLKGKVVVTEEEDLSGNKYPKATCSFVSKSRDVFRVPIQLASRDLNLTVADVEATVINEEPILPLLRQVPGNSFKMHELGIGEYQLHPYISSSDGEYGTVYKLHLLDGRTVLSRGNVTVLLESGWRPNPEKPLMLVISRIEKLGENKFTVDCALRERLPMLGATTRPVVTVDAQSQTVPEPELVTVGVNDFSEDDIPY
jgi:hypothetical protein